jgi:hypothetical protein
MAEVQATYYERFPGKAREWLWAEIAWRSPGLLDPKACM